MVKSVRNDRGGGGGKVVYLYIVKIEDFHQILTAFLSVKASANKCYTVRHFAKVMIPSDMT